MVIIHNSEVLQELRDVGKLQNGNDSLPRVLANQIIPTIELNPHLVKSAVIKSNGSATTGAMTIYTTPTNQDFYITAARISLSKNAACDVATGIIGMNVQINGAAISLLGVAVLTATEERADLSISFPHPIKVDRGYVIQCSGTFTAGAMYRAASISGFLDETSNA